MARRVISSMLILLVGCGPEAHSPPPVKTLFEGLPVSGSLTDAQRSGFTDCIQRDRTSMRCRRHKVMFKGAGPYEAAVDLVGSNGSGGFSELIIWHDQDQYAVYGISNSLEEAGWKSCMTGADDKGDQIIYTHKAVPVRISMDLSYWGKRRLRVIPQWNVKERRC